MINYSYKQFLVILILFFSFKLTIMSTSHNFEMLHHCGVGSASSQETYFYDYVDSNYNPL